MLNGFKWEKSWVQKGRLRIARSGNVAEIFNGDIWTCGGAIPGNAPNDPTLTPNDTTGGPLPYDVEIYGTSMEFLNNFPERYSGLDKKEIATKLWGRRPGRVKNSISGVLL